MSKFGELIKKRIKLKSLIILIVLLMFNAYAWFVYTTKVSGEMIAHVEAWDVIFNADDEEKVSYVEFNIGEIFPGMEPVIKEVEARNMGEKQAVVTYRLMEVTILGENFSVEADENDDGIGDYTSEELLEILEGYPFHVSITISNRWIYRCRSRCFRGYNIIYMAF